MDLTWRTVANYCALSAVIMFFYQLSQNISLKHPCILKEVVDINVY